MTQFTNRKPKVLLLIKSLGLGGAERLLIDSISSLNRQQFDYHTAYIVPWKNFLEPYFHKAHIPIHCLGGTAYQNATIQPSPHITPTRSFAVATMLPIALKRLLDLHKKEKFDLIHADLPISGLLARILGRWSGVPVVYTEHNLQERYHPLTQLANRVTYPWNNRVLAVSNEVAVSASRAGMDRHTQIITLLNGVPIEEVRAGSENLNQLRAELGVPEGHLVVGTVAVLRRQKRLQDWLDTAARIASARDDVLFLLVGDGPERDSVHQQVHTLGLSERVLLPGFRPDGRRLMGLMDVYLMTSEFEGLPIAMLEAMALAKPIIATSVGGIPEVVTDGEHGYLTPIGAIQDLAEATLRLLRDPEQRQQMGRAAAHKVESHFHIKHRVQAIEQCYLEVLQEQGERGSK